jgi:hypothetical protein
VIRRILCLRAKVKLLKRVEVKVEEPIELGEAKATHLPPIAQVRMKK